VGALIAASVAVAFALLAGGGEDYAVTARFQNAGQLVEGNNVTAGGVPIGKVGSIELSDDGLADVELRIDDPDFQPLRAGTEAIVRVQSLTGVANRYVDLRMPSGRTSPLADGGTIRAVDTTSAVDLDQLFNTFDKRTRKDLQGVIQGFGRQYRGESARAARGWQYLNPALAASSRLFEELNRDTPVLRDFLVANAELTADLAERRDDLAGAVDELADFTGAVGREREALADAIGQLPPFFRRANSTFVNLRAAVDDLRPLIDESRPVARRLRPYLSELRGLTRDARPTIRDLSRVVRAPGPSDDLIDLTNTNAPVRDAALRDREVNGAEREGAFPAGRKALERAVPQLAHLRPYAPDLVGWFDDFSHSGVYDAVGGKSRVGTYFNVLTEVDSRLTLIPPALREAVRERAAQRGVIVRDQRSRCPGAAEHPNEDRSNPYRPTPDFACDPSQVLPGR